MRGMIAKMASRAPWTFVKAYYSNLSISISEDTAPTGVTFKSDGTKMYIIGDANDKVYQYSLSKAWDLSTASYDSVSLTISEDNRPSGLTFKSDGTKMYVVGFQNDKVYQYSLSSAWDISTASYDSVSLTISEDTFPVGVVLKSDGAKIYIAGNQLSKIYQYSLSSAWDLSTASYDNISFTISEDTGTTGVDFKPDGTKMYVVGNGNDKVYQYSLSTAWDISTASYDSVSLTISSQDTGPDDIILSPNGTNMYIVGNFNNKVFQYFL